ncbi:MAG: ABC transporter ATP-binding protein [Tepidisphaeraceae bacterium]
MPTVHAVVECPLRDSFRVRQVAGMFDLPAGSGSHCSFTVELPSLQDAWSIGVIVGPSGSGKTTVARQAFGDRMVQHWDWPADQSILDGFPANMGVRDITQLLGSVGFSSPPAWMRPFHLLSNGEQFRVSMARTLAELAPGESGEGKASPPGANCAVVDEFTSVVDRTVARIGSSAISRAVRQSDRRFVAVTCHYDVLPWLEPDWVLDMGSQRLERRGGERREESSSLIFHRPEINLEIVRCGTSAWKLFGRHHYLSGKLHPSAQCFMGLVEERPAAFVAVLPFPHPVRSGWREHRCVCLPDFQGVGIGNAMSEFVASLFVATGKPYRSVTSHPAMIHHRARSPQWRMSRSPSRIRRGHRKNNRMAALDKTLSSRRLTASFEYVGEARDDIAARFGIGAFQMERVC